LSYRKSENPVIKLQPTPCWMKNGVSMVLYSSNQKVIGAHIDQP